MSAEDKFLLLSNIDDIRAASDEVYVGKVTGKGLSTEDYTTDEKTKLAGIDEGADENAIEVVKVNGAALAIANKMVDILIATGSANGTIKVNNVDVSVANLAALAFLSEVSESELATALKNKIDGKAEASALTAIIGEDTGKTIREVAAAEVAKIVGNADQSLDTLEEIAAWILNDTTGAAKMANDIAAHTSKLTLGTHEVEGEQVEYPTVKAYVEAVVTGLGLGNYVEKEAGKGLSTNDYTDAAKAIVDSVESGAQVNVIEDIEVNGVSATISGKSASITLPTATSSEVRARFAAAGN